MSRLLVAAAIVAVVAVVALIVRSRRAADPPTQRRYHVPAQLDRRDFARPDSPWLVAVFTSATCNACQDVLSKARVLETAEVAVAEVEFDAARELHSKYDVDAVPMVLICGPDGVTRASFLGPVTATDLWAAVAEARDPGSSPEPHLGQEAADPPAADPPASG